MREFKPHGDARDASASGFVAVVAGDGCRTVDRLPSYRQAVEVAAHRIAARVVVYMPWLPAPDQQQHPQQ